MTRAEHPPHLEQEVTLAVADDLALPDLADVPGTRPGGAVTHELHATYLDTPTWALLRRGLTLRHRTGGDDAGWHLKVPAGDRGTGPADLVSPGRAPHPRRTALARRAEAAAAAAHRARPRRAPRPGRRPRHPAGERAARRRHRPDLGDPHRRRRDRPPRARAARRRPRGRALAGVGGRAGRGRGRAGRRAARAVVAALRAAGAEPSPTTSKLRRALGDVPLRSRGPAGRARRTSSWRCGWATLVERLREEDLRWRGGPADPSVHRLRTTVRRLRSVLQTYGAALDPGRDGDPDGPVAQVQRELRRLGGELGHHRDAEVLRARLLGQLSRLRPGTAVDGHRQAEALVEDVLGERLEAGARRVDRALASARYRELLAALDALAVPPRPDGEDEDAVRREVSRLVRRDAQRLRRAVARADAAPAGDDRDTALHEARKRAKRLRTRPTRPARSSGGARSGCPRPRPGCRRPSVTTRTPSSPTTRSASSPPPRVTGSRRRDRSPRLPPSTSASSSGGSTRPRTRRRRTPSSRTTPRASGCRATRGGCSAAEGGVAPRVGGEPRRHQVDRGHGAQAEGDGPVDEVAEIDEDALEVSRPKHAAAGVPAVAVALARTTEAMNPSAPARRCSSSTRPTGSTARAAPGPTPTRRTGTPPSSARTAPRRSPRRGRCAAPTPRSSSRTR